MRLKGRIIFGIVIGIAGLFLAQSARAQVNIKEGESKQHRKMWRFWRPKKKRDFNPYVKHGKATHEASRQQKREDDKALIRAKKEYKKSIKRSARKRGGK
jgi:hypothetical protein